MKKRGTKIMCLGIIMCLLTGCSKAPEKADFSGISSVCELATLKCYYHNVAKGETEANGLLKVFGSGYKKIWTEYSGIVELGIDVSKVEIAQPDKADVVKVTIPDAKILNVDFDEESMSEPLTDTGFLTKEVTKEEETAVLAAAQESMEKAAQENTALLAQAKERAKNTIRGYIENVGRQLGKTYIVEWEDAG